jgi:SAM-dependent methyltransferase
LGFQILDSALKKDPHPNPLPAYRERGRDTLAFGAATFLGAFLLFLVQPLIAKYILPWFGGGPAVWTTCMLFFQTVLLAGYAYAHLGIRKLSPRTQAALHVVLLAAAVLVAATLALSPPSQPRAAASASASTSELAPLLQILLLLTLSVGVPCLVLSATSPLLNAWYGRTAPDAGARIYRLYAVSNAGSLLALVAYPFLVEPTLSRRAQAQLWSAGLALFAVLCGYCAIRAARRSTGTPPASLPEPNTDDSPAPFSIRAPHRLLWLALPACASVLLLATTNTMTHDVAAMPLLWVLPLAVYLLTFILAFDARRWYRRWIAGVPLALAAFAICAALLGLDLAAGFSIAARVALLAAALFVCCLVCHGELAALKPPPRELTAYYLTIAAGGALGGLLVAVVAPLVLNRYIELHAAVWTCCLLALVTAFISPSPAGRRAPGPLTLLLSVVGLMVLGTFLWAARDPYSHGAEAVDRRRDFYGVLAVYKTHADDPDRASLLLRHGGVTHGLQFLSPAKRRLPTTYFGETTGIGVALRDPPSPGTPGEAGGMGDRPRAGGGEGQTSSGTAAPRDVLPLPSAGEGGGEGERETPKGVLRSSTPHAPPHPNPLPQGERGPEEDPHPNPLAGGCQFRSLLPEYRERGNGRRVGIVGLGAGTIAAYGRPGDAFRYYELSPTVERIARQHFTFLQDSAARCDVVLGDARLSLEREPPQDFDVLVLDAFSGHAIPVHLLTAEAFDLYKRHLAPGGVIAVHVSNAYVDLQPVVARQAARGGWTALRLSNPPGTPLNSIEAADWILLTDNPARLDAFRAAGGVAPREDSNVPLWTDEYASLYHVLRRREE